MTAFVEREQRERHGLAVAFALASHDPKRIDELRPIPAAAQRGEPLEKWWEVKPRDGPQAP